MSKAVEYVKCPRCDLNYMLDTEEYCDVCKAELGMKSNFILEDDDVDLDEELTKLCDDINVDLSIPPMKYCTDNAAMIAFAIVSA